MSKGFDGWQNYYFEPEEDDEDWFDEDDVDRSEDEDYFEPTDDDWEHYWEHYKDAEEWEVYKPNIWQRFRSWLRWHWRYKWWNACPDCHRPYWWGRHDHCIPF